jgi:hypothetical protein
VSRDHIELSTFEHVVIYSQYAYIELTLETVCNLFATSVNIAGRAYLSSNGAYELTLIVCSLPSEQVGSRESVEIDCSGGHEVRVRAS